MLLMTEPRSPPEFWSFPGRPTRRIPDLAHPDGSGWREHPLAPVVDALLSERGLDEWDIDLFADNRMLYVITAAWPHEFKAGTGRIDSREMSSVLSPDLDHLVAWRRRDAMVAAAFDANDAGPWITPPSRAACGHVGSKPEGTLGDALPLWAVVASTALLGHLQRVGMSPLQALRHACAQPSDPDNSATWATIGGMQIHFEAGRLHAREITRGNVVDDWYGLTLNLAGQHLPDTIMAAAVGRRLGDIVEFQDPPSLLDGLDPVITKVEQVKSYWANAMATGLLVTVEMGTERLGDIPMPALAAVGDKQSIIPRSEKPWLTTREGAPSWGERQ